MFKTYSFIFLLLIGATSLKAQQGDSTVFYLKHSYRSLAKALKNPTDVYLLDLKGKSLSEWPSAIFRFPNLTILILDDNIL